MYRTATCLFLLTLTSLSAVWADDPRQLDISEQELKEIADGALTLMAFQVLPDITTSSLSIQKASSDDPGIWQTTLDAYGLGGSVVLDYERYREEHELDVEVRYTKIRLHTFGNTTSGLKGESTNDMLSVWGRWREPTGFTFLQRPLRYVLETSFTSYFGPQRGALGFDHLASVGGGFEIDTSAYSGIISRARLVGC